MREAIFLITAFGLAIAGFITGDLQSLIKSDQTFIVLAVVILGVVTTALAGKRRGLIQWVTDNQVAPFMGLLGTVAGFMIALGGITGDITADKLSGVDTALTTTAAGMVIHLWLLVVREATRR